MELLHWLDPDRINKNMVSLHYDPWMTFPTRKPQHVFSAAWQLAPSPVSDSPSEEDISVLSLHVLPTPACGFSLSAPLPSVTPIKNPPRCSSVPLTKGTAEDLDVAPKWLRSGWVAAAHERPHNIMHWLYVACFFFSYVNSDCKIVCFRCKLAENKENIPTRQREAAYWIQTHTLQSDEHCSSCTRP